MNEVSRRFSTGLRFLDQRMGGGVVSGGILVFLSPPSSQAELLFREFATAEPLVYVSTVCPDKAELREILDCSTATESVKVTYYPPNELLSTPTELLDEISNSVYVVFDVGNAFEEASREVYLEFLNALKRRVRTTGSLAVLHCLRTDPTPNHRSITLKRADHVWELRRSIGSSEITVELCITKSRSNQLFEEPIPLNFSDGVSIDTSQTIA